MIRRHCAERRYKPTKLQFMREVEEGVPILETEAAKVLRAPPVGITINIRKGRCMLDAAPTVQEAPRLVYGQTPKVTEASWKETMLEWWSVVVEAVGIFDEARKK
ncbi:Ff.00g084910.m01.CDS01 [Fusarium sp. VM40]|nr:Ff.00g084910.m01.CDS01 [Fusarium sp. VM40]